MNRLALAVFRQASLNLVACQVWRPSISIALYATYLPSVYGSRASARALNEIIPFSVAHPDGLIGKSNPQSAEPQNRAVANIYGPRSGRGPDQRTRNGRNRKAPRTKLPLPHQSPATTSNHATTNNASRNTTKTGAAICCLGRRDFARPPAIWDNMGLLIAESENTQKD